MKKGPGIDRKREPALSVFDDACANAKLSIMQEMA